MKKRSIWLLHEEELIPLFTLAVSIAVNISVYKFSSFMGRERERARKRQHRSIMVGNLILAV